MYAKLLRAKTKKLALVFVMIQALLFVSVLATPLASAETPRNPYCGDPNGTFVNMSVDLGCIHQGNPIADATFAIIRFISDGVGLIIIGSVVYAGLQYILARGDPQAVAAARKRIQGAITALLIFIFAYAILNYVIPGQIL